MFMMRERKRSRVADQSNDGASRVTRFAAGIMWPLLTTLLVLVLFAWPAAAASGESRRSPAHRAPRVFFLPVTREQLEARLEGVWIVACCGRGGFQFVKCWAGVRGFC